MSFTAIAIAAVLAQAAPLATTTDGITDVAYTELAAGDADAAVQKLEAVGRYSADPALLINLGTAYARQGATDKALAAYRAAIATSERYDLELANGSWRDSRDVARHALASLQRARAQAAR